MRRHWLARGLTMALFAVLFALVLGYVVMNLWNSLTPVLFGWHVITFWQAVGLLILSRILFGGFHGRGGRRMHWRNRMRERWQNMTPEEREKMRQGFAGRCGSFGEHARETKVGASG